VNPGLHQDLEYGVTGQTLVFDAPEGRPSSVTSVTVYQNTTGDDGSTESATTGSAAVETNPNTTFDADSGDGEADARVMNLTATTGIEVGRTYLIESATGEHEWPEVVAIANAASATARHPLANAYTTADTFKSTRMTISVDSTWIADQSNLSDGIDPRPGYRVRWVYVVASKTYVHDSYCSVVRYRGRHTVTPSMLDSMYPAYRDRLPHEHREDEGRALIAEAYEQVRWDWQASDMNDAAMRDRDAVNRAVMLRFGVVMAEASRDPDLLTLREQRYREFFDRIFRVTMKVAASSDDSGAAHRVAALPLMTK
jgi:hypothetical protein